MGYHYIPSTNLDQELALLQMLPFGKSRLFRSLLPVAIAAGLALVAFLTGCHVPPLFQTTNNKGKQTGDIQVFPDPPRIGQPMTVLGHFEIEGASMSTSTVRIQLVPVVENSDFRLELGTFERQGRYFSFTTTLQASYGGVIVEPGKTMGIVADLGKAVIDGVVVPDEIECKRDFKPVSAPATGQ